MDSYAIEYQMVQMEKLVSEISSASFHNALFDFDRTLFRFQLSRRMLGK